MGLTKYFFDTYAIIEMISSNQNYFKFFNEEASLTIFNLAELYYTALNQLSQDAADEIYETYKKSVVEISDEILKSAMKFRMTHKKKNLSYADCIGYIYALKNNLTFLTGDKEFEGMKNVEFVK